MAGRYVKQLWQSGTVLAPYGPISGARMQHMDDALTQIFDDFDGHVGGFNPHPQYFLTPSSPVTNGVFWYNGTAYVVSKIGKDQIADNAGILKTQLAALHIVDADVDSISAGKITGLPIAIPAGVMVDFGGDIAPTGWVLCDGATYDGTNPIYTPLWNAIGTRHGGSGQNAFMVPDCRGRATVGKGTHADVDTVGKSDGASLANRRPKHAHTHALVFSGSAGTTSDQSASHTHAYTAPNNAIGSAGGSQTTAQDGRAATSGAASNGHTHTFTPAGTVSGPIGTAGMNESAAYLVAQKIIKL